MILFGYTETYMYVYIDRGLFMFPLFSRVFSINFGDTFTYMYMYIWNKKSFQAVQLHVGGLVPTCLHYTCTCGSSVYVHVLACSKSTHIYMYTYMYM